MAKYHRGSPAVFKYLFRDVFLSGLPLLLLEWLALLLWDFLCVRLGLRLRLLACFLERLWCFGAGECDGERDLDRVFSTVAGKCVPERLIKPPHALCVPPVVLFWPGLDGLPLWGVLVSEAPFARILASWYCLQSSSTRFSKISTFGCGNARSLI